MHRLDVQVLSHVCTKKTHFRAVLTVLATHKKVILKHLQKLAELCLKFDWLHMISFCNMLLLAHSTV